MSKNPGTEELGQPEFTNCGAVRSRFVTYSPISDADDENTSDSTSICSHSSLEAEARGSLASRTSSRLANSTQSVASTTSHKPPVVFKRPKTKEIRSYKDRITLALISRRTDVSHEDGILETYLQLFPQEESQYYEQERREYLKEIYGEKLQRGWTWIYVYFEDFLVKGIGGARNENRNFVLRGCGEFLQQEPSGSELMTS